MTLSKLGESSWIEYVDKVCSNAIIKIVESIKEIQKKIVLKGKSICEECKNISDFLFAFRMLEKEEDYLKYT